MDRETKSGILWGAVLAVAMPVLYIAGLIWIGVFG